ncbi:hypothetical protein [Clostridium sp.]|uniref:hypothetical protein n=1 Tax=Clostridium sp. TaxID=1506 RepID=UPI003F3EA798
MWCIFGHNYDYEGSYYQEVKPSSGNLYGIEVFRLFKCLRCGKMYKEKIMKYNINYTYDLIISSLKDNGYIHINKYYNR